MDYRLQPQTRGFKSFELRRQFGSDEVELLVLGNSYLMNHMELSGWLVEVGCNQPTKIADWAWNYRRVIFDLEEQVLSVPDDQSNGDPQREIEALAAATLGKHILLEDLPDRSIFDDPVARSAQHTQRFGR